MGSNIKAIKTRIKSIDSTMHLTKAMQLVASSKMKGATEAMEQSRCYLEALMATVSNLISNETKSSEFIKPREVKKTCLIVIAGDRGLAGGYNGNIYKKTDAAAEGKSVCVLPIGKRTVEHMLARKYEIVSDKYISTEKLTLSDCAELGRDITKRFKNGEFDKVVLISTKYASMLAQLPQETQLLPIPQPKDRKADGYIMFEPDSITVLNSIIPSYISGMVYASTRESFTSELSARRNAMDSATKNAEEMMDKLSIEYNRARQSTITQEITEIVAGSEA